MLGALCGATPGTGAHEMCPIVSILVTVLLSQKQMLSKKSLDMCRHGNAALLPAGAGRVDVLETQHSFTSDLPWKDGVRECFES